MWGKLLQFSVSSVLSLQSGTCISNYLSVVHGRHNVTVHTCTQLLVTFSIPHKSTHGKHRQVVTEQIHVTLHQRTKHGKYLFIPVMTCCILRRERVDKTSPLIKLHFDVPQNLNVRRNQDICFVGLVLQTIMCGVCCAWPRFLHKSHWSRGITRLGKLITE